MKEIFTRLLGILCCAGWATLFGWAAEVSDQWDGDWLCGLSFFLALTIFGIGLFIRRYWRKPLYLPRSAYVIVSRSVELRYDGEE